ncbi:LysR substrate-binding domain-containing protein, partial [Mesorhizobium sp. M7A.F.Ca.CA.004.02.1.1]
MRNLTLKHFKTIQAITKCGKIVSAAKMLGLSPPALTIQLRQVEEEFQLALFDRTSDGMRPTAAGRAFVETAQVIEEHLGLLEDKMDAIKGVRTGSLRLGVVSTAKYFAPRLMAAFMKDHPDIDMRLAIGNRAQTIDNLRNHDIDIALMGRPAKEVPVRASVFGDHPLVIIAPPDHPLVA